MRDIKVANLCRVGLMRPLAKSSMQHSNVKRKKGVIALKVIMQLCCANKGDLNHCSVEIERKQCYIIIKRL